MSGSLLVIMVLSWIIAGVLLLFCLYASFYIESTFYNRWHIHNNVRNNDPSTTTSIVYLESDLDMEEDDYLDYD